MSDLDARLTRCFRAVFPALDPASIPEATVESIPAWDSLASVTLVRVIEEEFDITIDLFDLEYLCGYRQAREYLASRAA